MHGRARIDTGRHEQLRNEDVMHPRLGRLLVGRSNKRGIRWPSEARYKIPWCLSLSFLAAMRRRGDRYTIKGGCAEV